MSDINKGDYVWVGNEALPWRVEHEDVGGLTLVSKWVRTTKLTAIPNRFPQIRSDYDARSKSQEEGS